MCENLVILRILTLFLDNNSKHNQYLKKASTKVPIIVNNLSYEVSYMKIGAFLLPF